MSAEAVNVLMMKVMTDKYCHAEKRDLSACMAYYVPAHIDGSYVDQSLQRQGLRKCEDHQKAYQLCIADERRQQLLVRQCMKMQQCKDEVNALRKCQQANGGKNNGMCDPQFYAMCECGFVNMIKSMSGGGGVAAPSLPQ